jgi:DegV family protein with EDD domain
MFKNRFEEHLAQGIDVLYVGMSAGLSATFTAAKLAAEELAEEYPERKVRLLDSRSGSGGVGLIAYLAAQKREEGADLEEVHTYMTDICSRMNSWFTVDDLFFLKRGGRLSTATAIVGSLFMIKPILTVDDEGKLFAWGKGRGKKGAIDIIVRRAEELAFDPENSTFVISHADCMEDAVALEMLLRTKWDIQNIITTDIGPAFGAHCGPGGLALFFIGKETEDVNNADECSDECPEEITANNENNENTETIA